jgi:hypothetical protein
VAAYLKRHPHGSVTGITGPHEDGGRPYYWVQDDERGQYPFKFYHDEALGNDLVGTARVGGRLRNVAVVLRPGYSAYDHFFGDVFLAAKEFLKENKKAFKTEQELRDAIDEAIAESPLVSRIPGYRIIIK